MNALGKSGEKFVFLIDFEGNNAHLFRPDETDEILWQLNGNSNYKHTKSTKTIKNWSVQPVSYSHYKRGFDLIQSHIHNGDTYLLNYTQPTPIETNFSLEDIFHYSRARYKILFKDKFVCFSPEIFVQIDNGKISSYPMKGTIDAGVPNARERIMADLKETAEHVTIVDLIRNDLSMIARNVHVERFRYIESLQTEHRELLQVSSKISGILPNNYAENIGSVIFKMLPAGSISGAPKKKTIEIIKAAEQYERGFYTGIFGYFDGRNLDSCVLIRYIENQNGELIYKSGGGITSMSNPKAEYEELKKKVYIPSI